MRLNILLLTFSGRCCWSAAGILSAHPQLHTQHYHGDGADTGVRAYKIYFHGSPYGVVTKEGFDQLMQFELLKKQRTVELVDNYKQVAAQAGVQVMRLQNRDGSKTLIKVEVKDGLLTDPS